MIFLTYQNKEVQMPRKPLRELFSLFSAALLVLSGCSDDGGSGTECGNGVIEGTEICDGNELGAATCVSRGFIGGDLFCNTECTIDTSGCYYSAQCGNDVIEGDEVCDGANLDEQDCTDHGFAYGDLACNSGCDAFDTSSCYYGAQCGNDVIEGDEVCDDGNTMGGDGCSADCRWDETCDHTISPDIIVADGGGNYSIVMPGDIVCIPAGTRNPLRLMNFHGTSGQPITFINSGGRVILIRDTSILSKSLQVDQCSFLRLTGTGSIDSYGFKLMYGMKTRGPTTDIEFDHFESTGSTIKFLQEKIWGFVDENTYIHHNYVHDIPGSGFYIGHNNKDEDDPGIGAILKDLTVSYNRVENTSTKGINIKVAVGNVYVHHNTVENAGFGTTEIGHQGCLTLQSSSSVPASYADSTIWHIHSNSLSNCSRIGLLSWAYGSVDIYNNVIVDVDSYSGDSRYAILISEYTNQVEIYNNTIIQNTNSLEGIHINSGYDASGGNIYDNIIAGAFDWGFVGLSGHDSLFDVHNNITDSSISSIGFVDAVLHDYHLRSDSVAVDAGSVAGYAPYDRDGTIRPQGPAADIGAYEYVE